MNSCPYYNRFSTCNISLAYSKIFLMLFILALSILPIKADSDDLIISCGGHEEMIMGCIPDQELSGLIKISTQKGSPEEKIFKEKTYGIYIYLGVIMAIVLLVCSFFLIILAKRRKSKGNYPFKKE